MNLTINQIMILLDIYRGTLKPSRHTKTYDDDMKTLISRGLIKVEENQKLTIARFEPTSIGNNMVLAILKQTIQ